MTGERAAGGAVQTRAELRVRGACPAASRRGPGFLPCPRVATLSSGVCRTLTVLEPPQPFSVPCLWPPLCFLLAFWCLHPHECVCARGVYVMHAHFWNGGVSYRLIFGSVLFFFFIDFNYSPHQFVPMIMSMRLWYHFKPAAAWVLCIPGPLTLRFGVTSPSRNFRSSMSIEHFSCCLYYSFSFSLPPLRP